jgi:riboflavin synthase alpha subunit
VSKAKAKGTLAETALVDWLRENGWSHAERRIMYGAKDKGDITLGDMDFVVEVKNHKTYAWSTWMHETEAERVNAAATFGVLVVKPRGLGVTRVGDWWACLPMNQMNLLLKRWRFQADD